MQIKRMVKILSKEIQGLIKNLKIFVPLQDLSNLENFRHVIDYLKSIFDFNVV